MRFRFRIERMLLVFIISIISCQFLQVLLKKLKKDSVVTLPKVGWHGVADRLQLLSVGEESFARMADGRFLVGRGIADDGEISIADAVGEERQLSQLVRWGHGCACERFGDYRANVEERWISLQRGLLLLQCPLTKDFLSLCHCFVEFGIVAQHMVGRSADEGVSRISNDGVDLEVVGIGYEVGNRLRGTLRVDRAGTKEGEEEEEEPHPDPPLKGGGEGASIGMFGE